jgi:hypothetical protein
MIIIFSLLSQVVSEKKFTMDWKKDLTFMLWEARYVSLFVGLCSSIFLQFNEYVGVGRTILFIAFQMATISLLWTLLLMSMIYNDVAVEYAIWKKIFLKLLFCTIVLAYVSGFTLLFGLYYFVGGIENIVFMLGTTTLLVIFPITQLKKYQMVTLLNKRLG